MSIQLFFFSFLFSGYFCSLDTCEVCIVYGRWNQSSSTFLCSLLVVVFMHWRYLQCSRVLYLSTSSLRRKGLCIIMNFLVLWFIRWSSSLVHFKNGSEYLMKGQPSCLMRFLLCSLVSSNFLVLFMYFKNIIIIIPLRVFHTSFSWWFPREFEWQQTSSSLQDSSQYSSLSQ